VIVGIETGGTKVVCATSDDERPDLLTRVVRFPTADPDSTTATINAFIDEAAASGTVSAIGIASFGPVAIEPGQPAWGHLLGTPKPGWANADLVGRITRTTSVPTVILSDVASAALGESTWGAGRDVTRLAYATFGTGVGVGLHLDGRLLHGNGYPELGHLLVRRHPLDDYEGNCPFHGDCLEGLASGPAVIGRWGSDASSLPADHRRRAVEILGYYIAQLAAATAYATGIHRFVVGGGVLKTPGLLESAQEQLTRVTGGPGASHAPSLDRAGFVAAAALGDHSGVLGAIAAARDELLDRAARS
jgi:fructokinase